MNIYIVCEMNFWPYTQVDCFTLGNPLLGAVKLIKNTDFIENPLAWKYGQAGWSGMNLW